LRDGDKRDKADHLCVDTVQGLPRCMDLIKADEVIRRIELYYRGGRLIYLKPRQRAAARQGILATANSAFDREPLNIYSAGITCDRVAEQLPKYPGFYTGRGIVICGGGPRYFTNAWVCIQMLRRHGCDLPIELWHLGSREIDQEMKTLVRSLNVECVDALKLRRKHPARILHGWSLKPYSILHCRFREVLFLDADNVPVVNPEFLFETPQFQATGAIFWPDYGFGSSKKGAAIWRSCGLRVPHEQEFETGQILVDKERCWQALNLTMWFNENSDFYYQHVHGDKETFHLAFRKVKKSYSLVPHPIHPLPYTMCQHDFDGRRVFQHRNLDKWDLLLCNRQVKDFWFEKECLEYISQLTKLWNGVVNGSYHPTGPAVQKRLSLAKPPKIEAVMVSCQGRAEVRSSTLDRLAKTDWGDLPFFVQLDEDCVEKDPRQRQTYCSYLALSGALNRGADYVLFLEDDLHFNRHLRHNITCWLPIKSGSVVLASLYNPRLREVAYDLSNHCRVVSPNTVFGSQALLIAKTALAHIVRNWRRLEGMQDIRISRLAGRLRKPILYHAPSLVQHVGTQSTWGGGFHQAADFDPDWKA
ncbi:MAG TPA: hypothetical protein VEC99_14455, partial [Clostridia bacterium]|nr:hypothetical protein [Clostridia bacterium]